MSGMYFAFCRLAIRLLVAIFWQQILSLNAGQDPASHPVIADASAFLERYK